MDHVPVVAIVGQQASSCLGSDYPQEVDLQNLFKDVAASYVETIVNPAQVRHVVDRAIRIQYWERWSDPRFIVMVLVNHDLNQVTWEQRALAGDPKFDAAQDVIDFPYAKYGTLLGFEGIRVEKPDDIRDGWQRALAANRPCGIEFIADPDVPPIPPHITWDQATAYLTSLVKEDSNRSGIVRQSIKQMYHGIFPPTEKSKVPS